MREWGWGGIEKGENVASTTKNGEGSCDINREPDLSEYQNMEGAKKEKLMMKGNVLRI